jgi:hypothetical protein
MQAMATDKGKGRQAMMLVFFLEPIGAGAGEGRITMDFTS